MQKIKKGADQYGKSLKDRLIKEVKMLDKEFLSKYGLEEKTVEEIIKEYTYDLNDVNQKLQAAEEDRDNFKDKFEAADQSLKDLKEKDIEGTEAELEAYKQKYDQLEKKMAEDAYKRTVEDYVRGYDFTSDLARKAVVSELMMKELKFESGPLIVDNLYGSVCVHAYECIHRFHGLGIDGKYSRLTGFGIDEGSGDNLGYIE